jgi:hypothetical protein
LLMVRESSDKRSLEKEKGSFSYNLVKSLRTIGSMM